MLNGILKCLWTIRVSSCLLSAILWSLLWWGPFSLGCPEMYVPSTLEPLSSLCAPRLSPLGLHEDPSTFCYLWKMKIWNMRTLFPQTSFSEVSLIGENWLGIIVMGWLALPYLTSPSQTGCQPASLLVNFQCASQQCANQGFPVSSLERHKQALSRWQPPRFAGLVPALPGRPNLLKAPPISSATVGY